MPTSSALVEQINGAFERFLPRLELRCIVLEDQIHASLCEFGPEGEFLGRADQPQDFSALLHQPPTRAEHFVEGCALALETQVRDFESTGARDWLFKLGAPHELFPQVLLKAEALQTAEAFAAAIGDPWGLRAELETDELLEQHPEFQFLAKDALGRELVDALFGLFNKRFSKGRSMKLLRRVSTEDRSELAPVLVAFIDHTARAPDFRINFHPVATDSALQVLQRWGAVPEGAEGRWLDEGVISPPVVGA